MQIEPQVSLQIAGLLNDMTARVIDSWQVTHATKAFGRCGRDTDYRPLVVIVPSEGPPDAEKVN